MIKKFTATLMSILLCAIIAMGVKYNPSTKTASVPEAKIIALNGKRLKAVPLTEEGVTYLPLRTVCEQMGYNVAWNESSGEITVTKGKNVIKAAADGRNISISKKEYKLLDEYTLKNPLYTEKDAAYISVPDAENILEVKIGREGAAININYNSEPKKYVTFNSFFGNTTLPLSYSDNYFNKTSFEYSPEIAELAAALSSAAYGISSINKVYKQMGYTAEFYNYASVNKATSAYSVASKETGGKKIYIVSIRGTSGDEWYTNFDIYKDKNTPSAVHYGFAQAEKDIKSGLEKILEKDNYSGRKVILITGHSRGGAAANILGAELTKEEKYAQPQDIYTYTFATPNVSVSADEKLKNIYNFCSESDFITQIPLNGLEYDTSRHEWLYKKNGITIVFDNSDLKQAGLTRDMEREFRAVTGRNFTEIKKESVQTVIMSLMLLIPTVDDYYTKPLGIGSLQMSAYDFFISGLAASQTLGASAEKGMMVIADGLFNGDMSSVSKFLVFNSSGNTEKNKDGSITEKGQGIKYNHSCEAYYAWVKAYNKKYF